jgi:hypothetical protein
MTATLLLLSFSIAGVREAVAYLEAEVPLWKSENGCYSCHNNGDAARALLLAGVRGKPVEDTLTFLRDPSRWTGKDGKADPLALVQYANALAAAGESGGGPFRDALRRIAEAQQADGHWILDAEAAAGSPVTYGPVLGTALARELLRRGGPGFAAAARKAEGWLERQRPSHPMDIAALVLSLHRATGAARLASMQASDGSWNGGEVFDTAIAVIALQAVNPEAAARGRAWLLRNQLEPGGWRGTTRPPGGQSYAQHISTTAWALQALLAASDRPPASNRE